MAPFSHLLTDSAWVSEPTGVDAYGDESFGPAVQIKCAYEEGVNEVTDSSGNKVFSSSSFDTDVEVSKHARVWFSAADVGNGELAQTPISVTRAPSRIRTSVNLWSVFFR